MEKIKFQLTNHPWLFLLVFMVLTLLCQVIIGVLLYPLKFPIGSPVSIFLTMLLGSLLLLFIIVPFVLGFPKRPKLYETYLTEIRLAKVTPFIRLLLLGITCYVILAVCQVAGVLVYRLTQGLPIDAGFMQTWFRLSAELPPNSPSVWVSFPSVLEEVAFRGVILAMFLRFYKQRQAILFSALGFGIIHLFNIVNGGDPVWVVGQAVWAAILGLFYGYVTLRTGSLLPAMIFHYLSNVFVSALNSYINAYATVGEQVLYGVTFTMGVVPVILMILWTRGFTNWFRMTPASEPDTG